MKFYNASGISLHFEKHKGNSARINILQLHNERKEGRNHSNKNIDDNKTHENVILKKGEGTYKNRIDEIIKNERKGGTKRLRKDAVRLVEATVQLSGSILTQSKDKQEQVLKDSYNWINQEFGEKNIISAVIHKDETHMHLHVDFVPITKDGKLSAKELISRPKLIQYQKSSLKYISDKHKEYQFQRVGKLINGVPQKYLNIVNKYKKEKDQKLDERDDQLDKREDQLDKWEEDLKKEQKKYEKSLDSLGFLQSTFEKYKKQAKDEEEALRKRNVDVDILKKKLQDQIDKVKVREDNVKKREDIAKEHEDNVKKREDIAKEHEDSVKKREDSTKEHEDSVKKREDSVKEREDSAKKREDTLLTRESNLMVKNDNLTEREKDLNKREKDLNKRENDASIKERNNNLISKDNNKLLEDSKNYLNKADLSYSNMKKLADKAKKAISDGNQEVMNEEARKIVKELKKPHKKPKIEELNGEQTAIFKDADLDDLNNDNGLNR